MTPLNLTFSQVEEFIKYLQVHLIGAKPLGTRKNGESIEYYVVIKIEDGGHLYKLRSDKAKASDGIEWFQNLGRLSLRPTANVTFELRSSSILNRHKVVATTEQSPLERLITMQKGRLDDRSFVLSLSLHEPTSSAVWGTLQLNIRKIVVDTPKEAVEYHARKKAGLLSSPPSSATSSTCGGRDSMSDASESEISPGPSTPGDDPTIRLSPSPAASVAKESIGPEARVEIEEVSRM